MSRMLSGCSQGMTARSGTRGLERAMSWGSAKPVEEAETPAVERLDVIPVSGPRQGAVEMKRQAVQMTAQGRPGSGREGADPTRYTLAGFERPVPGEVGHTREDFFGMGEPAVEVPSPIPLGPQAT